MTRFAISMLVLVAAFGCKRKEKRDDPDPVPVVEPAAVPTPTTAPTTDGLPRSCRYYKLINQRLASCDKIPAQSRDSIRQGFEAMEQGWKRLGVLSPDTSKVLSEACLQAAEALRQAVESMCPPDTFKVEREEP